MLAYKQSVASFNRAQTRSQRVSTRPVVQCAAQLDGPSTSDRDVSMTSRLGGIFLASVLSATVAGSVMFQQPAFAANRGEQAVEEYIDLDTKGKLNKVKALEDFRNKYGLKRITDGRLMLKSSKGEWYLCRLDMEVPGSMLLRDSKGNIFAIQTDQLQQVDLSDDYVALMMFADGEWENQMSPIEYEDAGGKTLQLKMDESEFRQVVGLLKAMEAEDEEAAAQ